MGKEAATDDDHQELARRLFATATAMLEDATEVAGAGQSPVASPAGLAACARRLAVAAREVVIIAEAAGIAAQSGIDHPPNRRKTPR
jgi:hypothetical protein